MGVVEGALGSGNESCYDVQVVRLHSSSDAPVTAITAFEMWWINSPRERQAEYTISHHEKFLRAVHANISYQHGVYMDNHIGLWYQQGDAFVQHLRDEGVPFFSSGQFGAGPNDPHVPYTGIFVEGPSGQIYEFLALNQTVLPLKPSWDTITCGGHGGPEDGKAISIAGVDMGCLQNDASCALAFHFASLARFLTFAIFLVLDLGSRGGTLIHGHAYSSLECLREHHYSQTAVYIEKKQRK